MKLAEKILDLPVWKVGLSLILAIIVFFFVIEELFIHFVFHTIDRGITQLETVFKQDDEDLAKDLKEKPPTIGDPSLSFDPPEKQEPRKNK